MEINRIISFLMGKGFTIEIQPKKTLLDLCLGFFNMKKGLLEDLVEIDFRKEGYAGKIYLKECIDKGKLYYVGKATLDVYDKKFSKYVFGEYKTNTYYNLEGKLIKKLSEVF